MRWLPKAWRSSAQSASERSLTWRTPALASAGASTRCGEDGPEGDEVGVDAGVRLHVGVRGAEQFAGVLGGEGLDGVDVAAAGVEAAADGALGVLVAEPVAHGQQGGRGGVVLGGDQLEHLALVGELLADGVGDAGLDGADHVEGAAEGGGLGGGARLTCGPPDVAFGVHGRPRRTARRPRHGDGAASRWSVPSQRASHGPPISLPGGPGAAGRRPPCERRQCLAGVGCLAPAALTRPVPGLPPQTRCRPWTGLVLKRRTGWDGWAWA